jgi:hypothetical protein
MEMDTLNIGYTIEFETKNKRAKNCKIINKNVKSYNNSDLKSSKSYNDRYSEPNEVYWSKESKVNSWETLTDSKWVIHASGRGNPNDVKEDLKRKAKMLGANAIVNVYYSTSTGSEGTSSGKGIHYYTIHEYRGSPIIIGKKNPNGKLKKEIIKNIDEKAKEYKEYYDKKYQSAKEIAGILSIIIILIGIVTASNNFDMKIPVLIVEAIVLFFVFTFPKDHGWWLKKYI